MLPLLSTAYPQIASILILYRERLESKFLRFPLLILIVVLIALLWISESYQIYTTKMLDQSIYSTRFNLPFWLHLPIFYLIEMTWPYNNFHPISFFLYIIGLVGLSFFAWRRKDEDKFLLAWFFIVYIFFTIIANKHWRYVIPIFPVLAMCFSQEENTFLLSKKQSILSRSHYGK